MTRFAIAGKVYDAVEIDRLSMKDMLLFERQVHDALDRKVTWDDVTRWQQEMADLETDAEREKHPEILMMTAVAIWAARRAAGDPVTFDDAIQMPVADIKTLPDAQDHKKPAPKAKARKASGPAAKSPPDASA